MLADVRLRRCARWINAAGPAALERVLMAVNARLSRADRVMLAQSLEEEARAEEARQATRDGGRHV